MDKYKINYIFSETKDINEIFISVLNKELTSCPHLSLKEVKTVE